MNKRDFFKFLAFSPVAIPVAALAAAREGDEPERNLLTLQMQSMSMWNSSSKDPKVDLSIGKDGKLWVRAKGEEWKRVVTE